VGDISRPVAVLTPVLGLGSIPMNANPTPARVAVLFGGRSSEHAVSCVSAAAVVEALEAGGFEVVPVGITRSGRFVLVPQGPAALTAAPGALPEIADSTPATTSTDIATSVSDDVAAALGSVDEIGRAHV
jgi:D-alanine-D-alanine ligase